MRRGHQRDRRHEAIAAPVRRLDVGRRLRIVAEGLADLADADLERGVAHEHAGPHHVEELLLGHQPAGVPRQVVQHAERLGREGHGPAVALERGVLHVEPVGPEDQRGSVVHWAGGSRGRTACPRPQSTSGRRRSASAAPAAAAAPTRPAAARQLIGRIEVRRLAGGGVRQASGQPGVAAGRVAQLHGEHPAQLRRIEGTVVARAAWGAGHMTGDYAHGRAGSRRPRRRRWAPARGPARTPRRGA